MSASRGTNRGGVLVSDFDGTMTRHDFYIVSILQGANTDRIAALFDATGFWAAIAEDPFSRSEWLQAIRAAPSIKAGYYTVLVSRDVLPEVKRILTQDPRLKECFRD